MKHRSRSHPNSILYRRATRLGLSLADVVQLTRAPYGTVQRWWQGRTPTPRPVLRLLALWRMCMTRR